MITSSGYILRLIQRRDLVRKEILDSIREKTAAEKDSSVSEAALIRRLVHEGYTSDAAITEALAGEFGMEVVDLDEYSVSPRALEKITREEALKYGVLPLEIRGSTIEIAISDPLDLDGVDSLSHILGLSINTRLAPREAIEKAIRRTYGKAEAVEVADLVSEVSIYREDVEGAEVFTLKEERTDGEEAPIIRYVHKLIGEALNHRASDIHLEPMEKRFRVRYRVDGVLMEVENPPQRLRAAIVSRLKLMANMSIAEKRIPQDGRISIVVGEKEVDLRVSSVPTVYGESIVMRILDKEGLKLGLSQLGFLEDDQEVFKSLVSLSDGILLITGPTGSGKTTTLYGCLNFLNKPDRKIITVEDPVEYQITGINQVQVKREVGMGFSSALRAMLRQAPNVIMVREIRDLETAEIAINASLTGHLVFSTLHTNDAPSAVSRLTDIGIMPFLVSASMRAAMAQRLVRTVCKHCRSAYSPAERELEAIGNNAGEVESMSFYRGAGCAHCRGRGFYGRSGIFEIFRVTEELEQMIYENVPLADLRLKARQLGMRTMREDGVRKALSGLTTIDEVLAVTVDR